MADGKGSARDGGFHVDELDGDPFAELARLVDEPWTGEPLAPARDSKRMPSQDIASAPSIFDERWANGNDGDAVWQAGSHDTRRHDEPELGAGFEDALAEMIDAELADEAGEAHSHGAAPSTRPAAAAPAAASSYASWVEPRAAAGQPQPKPYEAPAPVESAEDPLESELETALRSLSTPANPRETPIHRAQSFAPERIEMEVPADLSGPSVDDFDELIASELAVMRQPVQAAPRHVISEQDVLGYNGYQSGHGAPVYVAREEDDEGAYAADRRRGPVLRKVLMAGGSVAALLVVGVLGVSLWQGTGGVVVGGGSDEPLLVKADTDPVKIVPKDPGGRSIPNQNKAVYERVQSVDAPTSPTQQALLDVKEEPVDIPPEDEEGPAPSDLPGVELGSQDAVPQDDGAAASQGEVQVADASQTADDGAPIPVLQPRRVRTLTVRPDGTLAAEEVVVPATSPAEAVASEAAAAAPTTLGGIATASASGSAPSVEATGSVDAAAPVAASPAPNPMLIPTSAPAAQAEAQPAEEAPAASVEVASAEPQPAPATPAPALPSGGYYVQISSHPSQALADQSRQTLSSRYAGVLSGHDLVIQSADIPGKGTYYRVRVAAASKVEASEICGKLKSAGGSCFISR
ncbi:SPOR domain-containing protein [Mangrovicella endophytica]|uniref:SPOR domain-containing protein n=1 Tax=Mangrovicella endophytica TaxID=2066697 RepID=UPI000C9DE794|nr:SPOR domain-containing protein [Mangrovicella endophytica]